MIRGNSAASLTSRLRLYNIYGRSVEGMHGLCLTSLQGYVFAANHGVRDSSLDDCPSPNVLERVQGD